MEIWNNLLDFTKLLAKGWAKLDNQFETFIMKESSQKNNFSMDKSGLYLAGLIIFFAVGGFFALSNLFSQYKNSQTVLQSKIEEAEKLNNLLTNAELLKKNLINIDGKILIADQALPEFTGGEELLSQLEKMAVESGVVLGSVSIKAEEKGSSPSDALGLQTAPELVAEPAGMLDTGATAPVEPALPYQKIVLDLEIQGSFDSLKNLLANMEKSLRIMDVASISGGKDKEGESYTLKVYTYGLPAKNVVE